MKRELKTKNKMKVTVTLELTPEELVELAKFLKRKNIQSEPQAKDDGGDSPKGNN